MSNRLFQNIVQQMRQTIDRTFGVIDHSQNIVACSDANKIGDLFYLPDELTDLDTTFEVDGYSFRLFGANETPEYAVFVEGNDEDTKTYASLVAISLSNIKLYYDEKYDRTNFIKNVALDNILASDIYVKARELQFNNSVDRVVLIVHLQKPTDVFIYDILQSLFPDRNKDFIFNFSEQDFVIVKEIKQSIQTSDLENLATSIVETLLDGHLVPAIVSIGTPVSNIKDLARSFKEAQVAYEVSHIFDTDRVVVNYERLGIARLIYQLPTTLCEMYLREVFKRGSIESLDQETLFTIQKFFDNSLNVSETSRKLFVHRNTLVYRLEKIKKLTGLDLREFDHAIVFKVALMVKRYLKSQQNKF